MSIPPIELNHRKKIYYYMEKSKMDSSARFVVKAEDWR